MRDRASVPHSYQNALGNVKTNEQHRKNEALVQDRIDEWPIFESRSKVKMLTDEQDFSKDQRIDNRKRVLRVVQMVL